MKDIVLTTINAKWTHPSLALRLLKANLGSLEPQCEIIEFALRQPLCEKTEPLLAMRPRILGISISIWNHLATIELLEALEKEWVHSEKPIVILGGPEISFLPDDAKIFEYADYIIRGEGETVFSALCESILQNENKMIGCGRAKPCRRHMAGSPMQPRQSVRPTPPAIRSRQGFARPHQRINFQYDR